MARKDLRPVNLSPDDGSRKDWPTIGTRVSPEDVHLVDAAAKRGGFKDRAAFIYDIVIERTKRILGLAA